MIGSGELCMAVFIGAICMAVGVVIGFYVL